jgi:hypothetical protein
MVGEQTEHDGRFEYSDMNKIEDYPGPTRDQPEEAGVGSPADERIVKPPRPLRKRKRTKGRPQVWHSETTLGDDAFHSFTSGATRRLLMAGRKRAFGNSSGGISVHPEEFCFGVCPLLSSNFDRTGRFASQERSQVLL